MKATSSSPVCPHIPADESGGRLLPMNYFFLSLITKAKRFSRENAANVAMMFGLSLVPLMVATGAGVDFARGVMVHQNMMEALDAAALAVGNTTSKPASCSSATSAGSASNASCSALQQVA